MLVFDGVFVNERESENYLKPEVAGYKARDSSRLCIHLPLFPPFEFMPSASAPQ